MSKLKWNIELAKRKFEEKPTQKNLDKLMLAHRELNCGPAYYD